MLKEVTLATAEKYVVAAIKAGLVPYVAGSPGCGKSKMVESVAKQFNLKMIDIRLAQEDPTTINGFPSIEDGRSAYLPPKLFPLEFDKVPEGYNGWLLFFDELPSAPRSVQAAAYKIILDRMIGDNNIHPKCAIVAAGNLATDNAIVNEMGTALRSRMCHIHVESNPDAYLTVASKLKFDMRVQSYLAYQKHKINNFKQFNDNSSDATFACERTWEFVSKILKANCPDESKPVDDQWSVLLCGTVGSTALEFVQYTHAFKDLPTLNEILQNPTTTPIPQKAAVKYLLIGMLVGNATMDNIDTICDYVMRLEQEFQLTFSKMLWGKADEFLSNAKVSEIFANSGNMMLSF